MTDKEKRELETRRKEAALKNMYYTRYFSVRYATAAFFFVNLYWLLMLYLSKAGAVFLLPLSIAMFAGAAMWEQSRMFTVHQRDAKLTRWYYLFSVALNLALLLLVLSGHYGFLYPFFSVSSVSRIFLTGVLMTGILLSLVLLAKLNRIHHNADKQYKRIQNYLTSLQR